MESRYFERRLRAATLNYFLFTICYTKEKTSSIQFDFQTLQKSTFSFKYLFNTLKNLYISYIDRLSIPYFERGIRKRKRTKTSI